MLMFVSAIDTCDDQLLTTGTVYLIPSWEGADPNGVVNRPLIK